MKETQLSRSGKVGETMEKLYGAFFGSDELREFMLAYPKAERVTVTVTIKVEPGMNPQDATLFVDAGRDIPWKQW